jgi:hypothetical protein
MREMKAVAALAALLVVAGACESPAPSGDERRARPSPEQEAAPAATPGGDGSDPPSESETSDTKPSPPSPSAELPSQPGALAAALQRTHSGLRTSIDRWLGGAGPAGRAPQEISHWALAHQRIYRKLARDIPLARRVEAAIAKGLRPSVRANVRAQHELSKLVVPLKPPVTLETTPPAPAAELLGYYKLAEKRSAIPWQVLAAVNFVESRFGRLLGPSPAGALGPMQFLPATWEQYGNGGDIMNPRDSILGAARYLSASGAPQDLRSALYAYNRSNAYVDAILVYARQITKRPHNYYGYYHWQVFVETTKGDVQLTGPGASRSIKDGPN